MSQLPDALNDLQDLPALAEGHVHVWRLHFPSLAQHTPALAALLLPEEQQRAARFVHAPSRNHFTITRGVLRLLLAQYLNTAPDRLELVSGKNGKPELAPPFEALHFNVSHSHDVALTLPFGGRAGSDGPGGERALQQFAEWACRLVGRPGS